MCGVASSAAESFVGQLYPARVLPDLLGRSGHRELAPVTLERRLPFAAVDHGVRIPAIHRLGETQMCNESRREPGDPSSSEQGSEEGSPDRLIGRCRAVAARVRPLYESGGALRERLYEPGLWMLVGLPSAGKSSFASAIRRAGREVVGVDEVREENGWEIGEPEWQEEAYRIAYERVEQALLAGVVFESTGLWEPARRWCIETTRSMGLPVRALVIATDPGVCAERERKRRPGNAFLAHVLSAYARTVAVLPSEGYTSTHWLDEAERGRLAHAWQHL